MAAGLNMFIMSKMFRHRIEYKITWIMPGRTTGNQVDHVLIKKIREKMIQDLQSYRGANITFDGHLIVVKKNLRVI